MSTHISVPPQMLLERILTLELVRVTERAAVSSARLRGSCAEWRSSTPRQQQRPIINR